jgi:hypothetical protein
LKGVETFKDGEDDSTIEIELPKQPTDADSATFTVTLKDPSGAAQLTSQTTCVVHVMYDVMSGVVGFSDAESYVIKQSEEKLKVKVERSGCKDGKVEVHWQTVTDDSSPFSNLRGVETFEDGEDASHIVVAIPEVPSYNEEDCFAIQLLQPKEESTVLANPPLDKLSVVVQNDIARPVVDLESTEMEVDQSEGKLELEVKRSKQKKGKVSIPWKLKPETEDSIYTGMKGEPVENY